MGLLNSITGNIEQARLVIYDYRESLGGELASGISSIMGSSLNTAKKGAALSNLKTKNTLKIKKFRDMATDLANEGSLFDDPSKTKTFMVHFNPSQLQIYATNLPVKKPDATGKSPPVQDSVTKAKMNLTVTLFFDEMNVADSFMADKFTGGLSTQGLKNIATGIAKLGGKKWTVQDEVEGLISALRNPYTRNVSFRWADFAFTGQLNNISAKYTMFSTSGRPVRAQVMLRIAHEMDDIYLKSWYDNYEKVFSGGSSSLGGAAQKVGNVLNFNL